MYRNLPLLTILITGTNCATSLAQEPGLVLRCSGSIETFGSKLPRSTKQNAFDLNVNTSSGNISGGFAELITNAEKFEPRVTETQISATAVGRSLLPKVFLLPGAFYSLNRFTGTYSLRASLHFADSNDFTETSVTATCEQASRKF
jgi:hypothetical protein